MECGIVDVGLIWHTCTDALHGCFSHLTVVTVVPDERVQRFSSKGSVLCI